MEGSASHGEHAAQSTYPLRVEAELDSHVSRWLWLAKWVLVIPYVIALVFPLDRVRRSDRGRVLRDPVHRPLPAVHARRGAWLSRYRSTSSSACSPAARGPASMRPTTPGDVPPAAD